MQAQFRRFAALISLWRALPFPHFRHASSIPSLRCSISLWRALPFPRFRHASLISPLRCSISLWRALPFPHFRHASSIPPVLCMALRCYILSLIEAVDDECVCFVLPGTFFPQYPSPGMLFTHTLSRHGLCPPMQTPSIISNIHLHFFESLYKCSRLPVLPVPCAVTVYPYCILNSSTHLLVYRAVSRLNNYTNIYVFLI